jgi:hypothetical protein
MVHHKYKRKKWKNYKSKHGIWFDNKFNKDVKSFRKKEGGRIRPKKKRCIQCGNKVKNHHVYCQKCWDELHYG